MTATYRAVRAAVRFTFAALVITAMALGTLTAALTAGAIASRILP